MEGLQEGEIIIEAGNAYINNSDSVISGDINVSVKWLFPSKYKNISNEGLCSKESWVF